MRGKFHTAGRSAARLSRIRPQFPRAAIDYSFHVRRDFAEPNRHVQQAFSRAAGRQEDGVGETHSSVRRQEEQASRAVREIDVAFAVVSLP
jgi:hypothetical protein